MCNLISLLFSSECSQNILRLFIQSVTAFCKRSKCIQRNLVITTACVPQDSAVKKNPNMYQYDKPFFPSFAPRSICCRYLLESPHRGNSNKYPQHMYLGVLNTVFLDISNYLPHLELRNRSIQIVVIKNFVVISNVGIKRFDCTNIRYHYFTLE